MPGSDIDHALKTVIITMPSEMLRFSIPIDQTDISVSVLHPSAGQLKEALNASVKAEYSQENMDFFDAIEHLKPIINSNAPLEIKNAFHNVMTTFVKSNAPSQINLPSDLRIALEKAYEANPFDVQAFTMALSDSIKEIGKLVNKDSILRFIKSPAYMKIMESMSAEEKASILVNNMPDKNQLLECLITAASNCFEDGKSILKNKELSEGYAKLARFGDQCQSIKGKDKYTAEEMTALWLEGDKLIRDQQTLLVERQARKQLHASLSEMSKELEAHIQKLNPSTDPKKSKWNLFQGVTLIEKLKSLYQKSERYLLDTKTDTADLIKMSNDLRAEKFKLEQDKVFKEAILPASQGDASAPPGKKLG